MSSVTNWSATYAPGRWVVLAGPTSLVVMQPAPAHMSGLLTDLWRDLAAAADVSDLAQRISAFRLDLMPHFAVFFWAADGMHSLVRGGVRVVDAATGDVVAQGEGYQTWNEVGLGSVQQVRVDLDDVDLDSSLLLPLAVGVVQAGAVILDTTQKVSLVLPTVAAAGSAPAEQSASTQAEPVHEEAQSQPAATSTALPVAPLAAAAVGTAAALVGARFAADEDVVDRADAVSSPTDSEDDVSGAAAVPSPSAADVSPTEDAAVGAVPAPSDDHVAPLPAEEHPAGDLAAESDRYADETDLVPSPETDQLAEYEVEASHLAPAAGESRFGGNEPEVGAQSAVEPEPLEVAPVAEPEPAESPAHQLSADQDEADPGVDVSLPESPDRPEAEYEPVSDRVSWPPSPEHSAAVPDLGDAWGVQDTEPVPLVGLVVDTDGDGIPDAPAAAGLSLAASAPAASPAPLGLELAPQPAPAPGFPGFPGAQVVQNQGGFLGAPAPAAPAPGWNQPSPQGQGAPVPPISTVPGVTGQPFQARPDQPYPNEPFPGRPGGPQQAQFPPQQAQFPGQAQPQFPGQPQGGQPQFQGQPQPGQPYPGQGQPIPGQGQFPGQPGQAFPGQGQFPGYGQPQGQFPGQPQFPGQAQPAQGQPFPGQQYGAPQGQPAYPQSPYGLTSPAGAPTSPPPAPGQYAPEAPLPQGAVRPSEPALPTSQPSADTDGTVFSTGIAMTHKPAAPRPGGDSLVLATVCALGHPNPPGATRCRVCGQGVDTANPRLVHRPTLAQLVTAGGARVELTDAVLIGRAPSAQPSDGNPILLPVPSPNSDISRTHLKVAVRGWEIVATDLHSTNGTMLVRPGQSPVRMTPGAPVPVEPGTILDLGDGGVVTVQLPVS